MWFNSKGMFPWRKPWRNVSRRDMQRKTYRAGAVMRPNYLPWEVTSRGPSIQAGRWGRYGITCPWKAKLIAAMTPSGASSGSRGLCRQRSLGTNRDGKRETRAKPHGEAVQPHLPARRCLALNFDTWPRRSLFNGQGYGGDGSNLSKASYKHQLLWLEVIMKRRGGWNGDGSNRDILTKWSLYPEHRRLCRA